jgi:hypothetical protein
MASARAPSARSTPWEGYKAVVPRRFSINPLHPFSSLFILAMSRASGLGRAPLPPPDPPLQARGPTERYDEASQKNALSRDCWLLFARGLGSTLSSTA